MGKKKKLLAMIMTFAVAISFMIIPATTEVSADSIPTVKYEKNIKLTTLDGGIRMQIDMGKLAGKGTDELFCKSSDPSVIWVQSDYPYFDVKKAGKAKITIKNKTKNKKYTCTITVVNKNPFKSFKIGKKEIKKGFRLGTESSFDLTAAKNKISITPKKGWKLKKIEYQSYKRGGTKIKKATLKTKKVKNNTKITFKKDSDTWEEFLIVRMYDQKEKKTHEFNLELFSY